LVLDLAASRVQDSKAVEGFSSRPDKGERVCPSGRSCGDLDLLSMPWHARLKHSVRRRPVG
jgi:hypothetical protein